MVRIKYAVVMLVVITTNLQLAYQQKAIVQMSQETSFCAKSSTESTLKTFWTEASGKCPMDPYRLMDLYEGMSNKTGSKCRLLLRNHLRKSLIDTSVTIFEEALISQTFSGNFAMERLAKRLFQLETNIQEAVWERVIDEVYLFMNRVELAEVLFVSILPYETKVTALLLLQRKFEWRVDSDIRFPVRMAYYLYQLKTNVSFNQLPMQTRFDKVFNSLPVQLRKLNEYGRDGIKLLNTEHWEYLYAPRENGPDDVRRVLITWTAEKNQTDSDGLLIAELSSDADVCFSSRFGKQLKPLYVDEEQGSPFIWIGKGTKDSRWWSVQYHELYLTFVNLQTKQLLCATDNYDENRR